jgi:hypothetical protein
MRIDDPPPTVLCNRAAITPRETGSTELVSDDFSVFHWRGMMPELAIPVQQPQTIIHRPSSSSGTDR